MALPEQHGNGDLFVNVRQDADYGGGSGASYRLADPFNGKADLYDSFVAAFHGSEENAELWVGIGAVDSNALPDLLVGANHTDGDAPTAGAAFLPIDGGRRKLRREAAHRSHTR